MSGLQPAVAGRDCGYALTVVDLDPLRAVIEAAGELDLAARQDLGDALRHHEDARRRFLRLDLSRVTFLDCSCLGVICAAHVRLLDRHGLLTLSGVDGPVARLLELTGLDEHLFVVPSDEDPFGSTPLAGDAPGRTIPQMRTGRSARDPAVLTPPQPSAVARPGNRRR